jgi:hypothetical protein
MAKKSLIILCIFLIAFSCSGYCQDSTDESKADIVKGVVAAVDWVAGILVVRTMDFGNIDEITFEVPDDVEITKGTNSIGFSSINLTDPVRVEYLGNSFSGLKAVRIMVL